MTLPLREQIIGAFADSLAAITGITGLSIERNRSAAVEQYPSLLIYDADENFIYDNPYFTKVTMTVIALGLVQSTSDSLIGENINQLYGKTIMAAMADTTLGNLCIDIRITQSNFEFEDNPARPQASFRAEFDIDYWLNPKDPYSVPPL
jgi:hypothetical protein